MSGIAKTKMHLLSISTFIQQQQKLSSNSTSYMRYNSSPTVNSSYLDTSLYKYRKQGKERR